jgi:hypothetical protein
LDLIVQTMFISSHLGFERGRARGPRTPVRTAYQADGRFAKGNINIISRGNTAFRIGSARHRVAVHQQRESNAAEALRSTFMAAINRVDNSLIFRHDRLGARGAAGPPKESINTSMVSMDILVLLMARADGSAGLV